MIRAIWKEDKEKTAFHDKKTWNAAQVLVVFHFIAFEFIAINFS